MASRVFLHVGTMKSATSYIQDLCDYNREALASHGVLWTKAVENFLATDDLLGTRRTRPGLEGAWERMAAALAAHPGDALISNELLAPVNPRKRRRLVAALEPAEVHVVITARDLGRVIPSQWQTGARNRNTITWSDYIGALTSLDETNDVAAGFWRRQDVPVIVESWARQVPLDRITVVTVPPSGVPASVLGERFASVLGVDGSGFEQPSFSNAAVGAHSAELLRLVNERTADLDWLHYRWAVKNALARLVLADRAAVEPPIVLTDEQRAWAAKRADAMVSRLGETGVRVVGDLGDLTPAEHGPTAFDPGDSTTADLLDVAVDAIAGVGAVLGAVRIEHDALIRAVEALLPTGPAAEAELAEFTAYEAGLEEEPSVQMVNSRFQRWRLGRLIERRAPG